jgi:hypothetical protein
MCSVQYRTGPPRQGIEQVGQGWPHSAAVLAGTRWSTDRVSVSILGPPANTTRTVLVPRGLGGETRTSSLRPSQTDQSYAWSAEGWLSLFRQVIDQGMSEALADGPSGRFGVGARELAVHYQPIITPGHRRHKGSGAGALAAPGARAGPAGRIHTDSRGNRPDPAAGHWVLTQACRQVARWQRLPGLESFEPGAARPMAGYRPAYGG